ncbi:hypothetical protein FB567DRAFT_241194 [Paraphoma chrysanthemicola]|uniref:Uncharacterized protein n=1 Tax=Paraphoma chrysanthemicola TaxID=798071 RepID=A0A8K0RE44_9PLEO|nr:hypothetical protein FB567DRAFT_241194 [Paraphoma chrysanthemicola]
MVSTRSKTAQTNLQDLPPNPTPHKHNPTTQSSQPKPNTSKKRKSPTTNPAPTPPAKRTKSASNRPKPANTDAKDTKIVINRAPVLQLWSACVTHFVYPDLSWETCLSAGSAISSICAIAKGRSIGSIPERDDGDGEEGKKKKGKDVEGVEKVKVMQFNLKLQDGLVIVGTDAKAKGKSGGEEGLKKKFGEEYGVVKSVFGEVLGEWKGREEEVQKNGFGWYERFRPDVSKGQKGWGRKGELDLDKVRSVVGV